VSSLAAGHKSLVPELIAELKSQDAGDIAVVLGGVVPEKDHAFMKSLGVVAIYGPGTVISQAARELVQHLLASQGDGR
jgi:methylmalonyl-CoA mutase